MNNIKISVIIPVYNKEKYIEDCLDSVIKQSLKNIEIILVDDGSTDNSLEILKKYEKKDNRIKVLTQTNLGPGIARNKGIEIAKGEYIGFVDADDCLIDSNGLKKMFELGKTNNCDMVSANIRLVINNGKDKIYHQKIEKIEIIPSSSYGIPWFFYKNIFKREFLIKNNITFPDYYKGEDPIFLAKVLAKINDFITIPLDYYEYIAESDKPMNSSNVLEYLQHFIEVFKILKDKKFYKSNHKYLKLITQSFTTKEDLILKNETKILEFYKKDKIIFEFFKLEFDLIKKEKQLLKEIMNL
jgi:glycosyltransferase involved in cell wall biosynthesis